MQARAIIRLKFPSEKELRAVYLALKPEAERPATNRCIASLKIEDDFLVLNIEARDTVALRAATNAYLRWILAIRRVTSALKPQHQSEVVI